MSSLSVAVCAASMSLPARGAWIEIRGRLCRYSCRHGRSPHGERGLKLQGGDFVRRLCQSLPARGAWIEMPPSLRFVSSLPSLPARGAWIEIRCLLNDDIRYAVAPRTGSVD